MKKQADHADLAKQVKDLGDLAMHYEELKLAADKKLELFRDVAKEYASTAKDNIRKTFVHFVSLMKNIEYDVNAELEVVLIDKEI